MANRQYNRCCNPFLLTSHVKKSSLRHPSEAAMAKLSSLNKNDLLCAGCRNRIDKMELNVNTLEHQSTPERQLARNTVPGLEPEPQADLEANPDPNLVPYLEREHDCEPEAGQSTPISLESLSQEIVAVASQASNLSASITLPVINEALQLLDNSPIPRKKLKSAGSDKWISQKAATVAESLKRSLGVTSEPRGDANNFSEMLAQLKEKYDRFETSSEVKTQILTVLPKSWNVSEIVNAIGATRYMAKKAKKLVDEQGILSIPVKKQRKSVSPDVVAAVVGFYEDDEMSAPMPGMKDYVSVKTHDGSRIHRQKRLILSNLKELYQCFKYRNPELSVGFSTFASLRPQHCVLAGDTTSTHTVCVCSIHQNMKLMLLGSNLPYLSRNSEHPFESYEDVLMYMTCDDVRPECNLGLCKQCPGVKQLRDRLLKVLKDNDVKDVKYKQWVSKPRTTLESHLHSLDVFIDRFCEQANVLLTHAFIAKQQSKFLRWKKSNLQEGECIIICDFAENYAFVVQDAAPGFHWNNNQATIYPVVVYYNNGDGLHHKSLAIITDCLHHDAVAVYEYSKVINEFVKIVVKKLVKVYYVSDGAPQQFKNFKNFVNLYYHEEDFRIAAEWHFFATAHGKGPCDGIGGTIKRLAARASLQLPADEQITTPRELYEWASKNVPSIKMIYYEAVNYECSKEFLTNGRFTTAKPIKNTQKQHCVIPVGNGKVITKRYSLSEKLEEHSCIK